MRFASCLPVFLILGAVTSHATACSIVLPARRILAQRLVFAPPIVFLLWFPLVLKLHPLVLCDCEISLPFLILCSQFVMMTTVATNLAVPLAHDMITAGTAANYECLMIAPMSTFLAVVGAH